MAWFAVKAVPCRMIFTNFCPTEKSMNIPQFQTVSGKKIKIPPFVWKSVEKLESEKEYLETDGLYRVPGEN